MSVTIKLSPKGLSNFKRLSNWFPCYRYHYPSYCWNYHPTSHVQASQQNSWILVKACFRASLYSWLDEPSGRNFRSLSLGPVCGTGGGLAELSFASYPCQSYDTLWCSENCRSDHIVACPLSGLVHENHLHSRGLVRKTRLHSRLY